MWATSQQPLTEKERRLGFTIVELLIVIVVIGILAAITIVAYNGVTQQARVASIKSDLDGAAKQLAIDQVSNSAYPATVAAANGGAGLKASPGTTYQYSVDNTASPQTFCITATNGATSYFVSSTNNVPTSGGCPITNLVLSPIASSTYPYAEEWGNGAGSASWPSSGGPTNGGYQRMTFTSGSNSGPLVTGIYFGSSAPLTMGVAHTWSIYVRSSVGLAIQPVVYTTPGPVAYGGSTVTLASNTWTRISMTFTPTNLSNTFYGQARVDSGVSGSNMPVGGTLDGTMAIMTQGSTLQNYADGSYPGWTWNGTANNSTSTGPPL